MPFALKYSIRSFPEVPNLSKIGLEVGVSLVITSYVDGIDTSSPNSSSLYVFDNANDCSDKIIIKRVNTDNYKIGDKLKITYDGLIEESYPAQISAIEIELIK